MTSYLLKSSSMTISSFSAWPLLLWVLSNSLILLPYPTNERLLGVGLILLFLPGWYWSHIFVGTSIRFVERFVLAIGLSIALSVLGTLFISYLSGPLTFAKQLSIANATILSGLILAAYFPAINTADLGEKKGTHAIYLLLSLFLLAAMLRFPMLGYAEFHEDEAEALMLGTRLFQGENYALFLHRKGPAQMLVPISFWLLNNQITEYLARFPFALSSGLSVLVVFFLGCRWHSKEAGFIAALLWAINGYTVAFARMVQYQALIMFLAPLTIYCLYIAWKEKQPRLQIAAAILLTVCWLSHFDTWFLMPAVGYIVWLNLNNKSDQPAQWKESLLAVISFLVLTLSFYIPYILDPEFNNTVAYLTESRIRPGLLHNNLTAFQRSMSIYSSHFYLPLLITGLLSLITWQSTKQALNVSGSLYILFILSVTTIFQPSWWQSSIGSLAIIPWGLLFGLCFWTAPSPPLKLGWTLLATPVLGYLFLVGDPRTHVYIIYLGGTLLAGIGGAILWQWLALFEHRHTQMTQLSRTARLAQPVLIILACLILVTIVLYQRFIFLQTESNLQALRHNWEGSWMALIYDDVPGQQTYFGYPKQTGWKVLGALKENHLLADDFRSLEEDFIIPVWYTYGQPRSCADNPSLYFIPNTLDTLPASLAPYNPVAQIRRENENVLGIYSLNPITTTSPIYAIEDWADQFDKQTTPSQFTPQLHPQHQANTQFGSNIELQGYDIAETKIESGGTISVALYWRALDQIDGNYRAFVHLVDDMGLWSQHDDDPICRLPTAVWRDGQRGVGQFRLPVEVTVPSGTYSVVTGLYQTESKTRLPITSGKGTIGDDFLWLGDVQIINN
ncbi:MAG: glycosyltransferase family 39 protein [Chloroflexota bacterium]